MKSHKLFVVLVLFVAAVLLASCSVSSSPASCAFVYGDGSGGSDSDLHTVIYPGDQVRYDADDELVSYVPCNSRNYIINDGTVVDANNNKVGDRHQPIVATTNSGVPVLVQVRAQWTLNQDPVAMENFYNVCYKYTCASERDIAGGVNYSTEGWNSMLAENFGPAMEVAVKLAMRDEGITDDIWKLHDARQYQDLADGMSALFADAVRANFGYQTDLFCGSGNSVWDDPDNPGASGNNFSCTPVRFVIDDVSRGEVSADDSTEGVREINEQLLENAQALYGKDAGYWLGLQDAIEQCAKSNVICVINIGGGNSPVAVPVPNPGVSPTPELTPTPEE